MIEVKSVIITNTTIYANKKTNIVIPVKNKYTAHNKIKKITKYWDSLDMQKFPKYLNIKQYTSK